MPKGTVAEEQYTLTAIGNSTLPEQHIEVHNSGMQIIDNINIDTVERAVWDADVGLSRLLGVHAWRLVSFLL